MTTTKEIQVPWLLSPIWKDFPMSKGLNHHRIPIGIILAANEAITFEFQSENPEKIKVHFFNDDAKTEGTNDIENTLPDRLGVLRFDFISVPFINCEYLAEIPSKDRILNVSYPTNSKLLPIFHYGDYEVAFFDMWNSQKAEFAYVESNYFALLIPEGDKEYIKSLTNGNYLNDLIVFYDEIFTIYSSLIGLSMEKTGTNENVRNRFFMKADKSGAGGAYYCDWCTAESTESVRGFWLNLSPTNWGVLHEIGHGHELKCLSDETFCTNEVWNNILVVFYQYIMLGDEILTKGGLSRQSTKIDHYLKIGKPVKEWGLFEKLSFLVHMFKRAGLQSFTRFNELVRQELAGQAFYASGTAILEKLMHLFAIDFGLDMYPFMKLSNSLISDEQLFVHYYSFSEVAYPLNYLISNQELLNNVKNKLRLWYDTSLVTPLELRLTNLKGNFTLKINECIFQMLFGKILKIMDGPRVIIEKRIRQPIITLKNLPIGVYKIFIATNFLTSKYVYDDFYAIVHADTHKTVILSAKTIESSSFLQDKIKFLGLGDAHFASLSIDLIKNMVTFNMFSNDPHCYFKDYTYASIKIKTLENEVIFSSTMEGTNCNVGINEIPLQETLQVEIFHAETKQRLKTEDPLMDDIIDHENNTNILLVSKLGFHNKNTPKIFMANRILNKIGKAANKIRNLPFLYTRPFCFPKYNLLLAIETFKLIFNDHPTNSIIEEQYKDCLPSEYSTINLETLISLNRCFDRANSEDNSYNDI